MEERRQNGACPEAKAARLGRGSWPGEGTLERETLLNVQRAVMWVKHLDLCLLRETGCWRTGAFRLLQAEVWR